MTSQKINLNKEIIALFSGQSHTLTIPKLYIDLTHSYVKANILNQCVYWSNKSKYKDGWFYKTYKEWHEDTHLCERALRNNLNFLEQNGWITTKVKKVNGLNIKHVKPDIDKIIEAISNTLNQECPNRHVCPDGSDTEQITCTKVAPTGTSCRSEPARHTGSSIYTDEYIHSSSYSSGLEKKSGGQPPVTTTTTEKNDLKDKPQTPVIRNGGFGKLVADLQKRVSEQKAIEQQPPSNKKLLTTNTEVLDAFKQKFEGKNMTVDCLYEKFILHNTEEQRTVSRFLGFIKMEKEDKLAKINNSSNDSSDVERSLQRMFESDKRKLIDSIIAEDNGEYSKASYACKSEWEYLRATYRKEFNFLRQQYSKQSA